MRLAGEPPPVRWRRSPEVKLLLEAKAFVAPRHPRRQLQAGQGECSQWNSPHHLFTPLCSRSLKVFSDEASAVKRISHVFRVV